MVVLPGSGGGIPAPLAAELASFGFTALALAYFGIEALPPELVEVPVELLAGGIGWLRQHSPRSNRIGILGQSKGAEYALVGASILPEDVALVAYVPSNVRWPGITRWQAEGERKGSWTWRGKPLPFLNYDVTPEFETDSASGRPVRLSLLYGASLDQTDAVEAATIEVERIRGPILLISAEDDQMWPSKRMADEVVGRLIAKKHPFEVRHLSYAGAGHFAGPPSFNAHAGGGGRFDLGGSADGNAAARTDSWPRVVEFLHRHLG